MITRTEFVVQVLYNPAGMPPEWWDKLYPAKTIEDARARLEKEKASETFNRPLRIMERTTTIEEKVIA